MRPTSLYLDDIKWERLYHRQITIASRKYSLTYKHEYAIEVMGGFVAIFR